MKLGCARKMKMLLVAAVAAFSVTAASAAVLTSLDVPDSLRPRTGEWGGMKAFYIPLPEGGELMILNEGGDVSKGLQKEFQPVFALPSVTALKSLIPDANRIEIAISKNTWFGVMYEDSVDPKMTIYEGGVIVKGMYTVVSFGVPKGRTLNATVRKILSQVKILVPDTTPIDRVFQISADQETPYWKMAILRLSLDSCPESSELIAALFTAAMNVKNQQMAVWCMNRLIELNPAVYGKQPRIQAPVCTEVVKWFDLKPDMKVPAPPSPPALPKPGVADGKYKPLTPGNTGTAVAENTQPADGQQPQKNEEQPQQTEEVAQIQVPPFKLPTFEEADEALRKLNRTNRRKFTPNRTRAKTVKPILADDLVNATTRKAAVAQLREGLQSLLGPFSEADQKRFDEKWNAVSEYPCEAILEWLKKACPIVTSMLMLKSELGALATDYDHAMHEADITRNLRNYEACDDWMQEVGRLASEMKGVQASLEEEANKLAALGEMPDPVEEKAAARKRHRAARETALEFFSGTPSEDTRKDIDGEYVTDGYVTYSSESGYPQFGGGVDYGVFGYPGTRIYLHPIAEFEEDGEKGVGLLIAMPSSPTRYVGGKQPTKEEREAKVYEDGRGYFAIPGKDGGYIFYDYNEYSKWSSRTVIAHDVDEYGKPALRVTHCQIYWKSGKVYQATAIFRQTERRFEKLPKMTNMSAKGVSEDRSEELYRRRMEMSFKAEFQKVLSVREQFEKMAETAKLKELPLSFELRYVLDRVECPDGKKVDLLQYVEKEYKTDWLGNGYNEQVNKVAESLSKTKKTEREQRDLRGNIATSGGIQFHLFERTFDPLGFTQRCQFDIGFIPHGHEERIPHKNGKGATIKWVGKREILDYPEDIMRVRWQPPLMVRVDDPKHEPGGNYKSPIEIPVWVESEKVCKHPKREYKEGNFRVRCRISTFRINEVDIFKGNCTNAERSIAVKIPLIGWGQRPEIVVELQFDDMIGGRKIPCEIPPSVRFHYKQEVVNRRHLAEREKELAEKFAQGGGEEKKEPETEEEAEAEAKQERIAFHKENIRFLQKTISGLKRELAEEKDPGRRSSLEYSIMLEESNIVYENDRIRAEQTGVFTATRTPFDDFCKVQFLQNIQKEIQEIQTLERAKKRVSFLIDKMPPGERETAVNLESKLDAESAEDLAQWRKLGDAMEKKYTGRLTYDQGMAESEVADREEALRRVEVLKKGCDYLMIMGGGELPQAISTIYSLSTSTLEEGWGAGLKTAITSWSKTIDYLWTAYEGYDSGGLVGMAQAVGMNYVMGEIVPSLVEKAKGVEIKMPWKKTPKAKTGAAKNKNIFADLNAMEFEMGKAKQEVDAFVDAYQKYESAKASGAPKEQLAKMEAALVKPIAQINQNPTAKAMMKYTEVGGKGPEFSKAMQAGFDSHLQNIHAKVIERFNALQYEKGYNRQQVVPIRNETSKGTVGMDADFGLVEQPSIRVLDDGTLAPNMWMRQNYERTTKQKWMVDAQASWNKAYAEVTGGYSAKKSWENITTSIHPEAYRDMSILKADPKKGNMAEIMEGISLSNAQQIMDVTRYKSDEMLSMTDFPRLVGLRESCRGTAKDMNTKLLPALDARIKPLKELEAKLTKSGQALWPDSARELQRLTAARDHYKKVCDSFDKIGKGKIPPKDWDDEVYTITGGMGINSCLNDMSDLFRSLFFAK